MKPIDRRFSRKDGSPRVLPPPLAGRGDINDADRRYLDFLCDGGVATIPKPATGSRLELEMTFAFRHGGTTSALVCTRLDCTTAATRSHRAQLRSGGLGQATKALLRWRALPSEAFHEFHDYPSRRLQPAARLGIIVVGLTKHGTNNPCGKISTWRA